MLLKKPNTLNYPIVFWNIAKFFQIVFRYLKHLDRLLRCELPKLFTSIENRGTDKIGIYSQFFFRKDSNPL